MGRLVLILVACVAVILCIALLVSFVVSMFTTDKRAFPDDFSDLKDTQMGSSGIQKGAYIALIVVLFGTATGWLGGL